MDQTKLNDARNTEYVNKGIELSLLRNVLNVNRNLLDERKNVLSKTQKELINMNNELLLEKDRFCDAVWRFSSNHNFSAFFNPRPSSVAAVRNEEDWCNFVMDDREERRIALDIKERTIKKLESDIESFKEEINILRADSGAQDLSDASATLKTLKLFSEELFLVIRSITTESVTKSTDATKVISGTENSNNNGKVLGRNRKPLAARGFACQTNGNISEFVSAKKLLKKANTGQRMLIGRKVTTKVKTIMTNSNQYAKLQQEQTGKRGKFILKNRSYISLKLEKAGKV